MKKVDKKYEKRIDRIKKLEEGWDSRDAKPIKDETIEDTKWFISELMYRANKQGLDIPELYISPGYDGSMAIETQSERITIFVDIPEEDEEIAVIIDGNNIRKVFGMKKMEFDDTIIETIKEVLQ